MAAPERVGPESRERWGGEGVGVRPCCPRPCVLGSWASYSVLPCRCVQETAGLRQCYQGQRDGHRLHMERWCCPVSRGRRGLRTATHSCPLLGGATPH